MIAVCCQDISNNIAFAEYRRISQNIGIKRWHFVELIVSKDLILKSNWKINNNNKNSLTLSRLMLPMFSSLVMKSKSILKLELKSKFNFGNLVYQFLLQNLQVRLIGIFELGYQQYHKSSD